VQLPRDLGPAAARGGGWRGFSRLFKLTLLDRLVGEFSVFDADLHAAGDAVIGVDDGGVGDEVIQ
jgi:hypothetical protein